MNWLSVQWEDGSVLSPESEFQEVFNNWTEGFPFIVVFGCFAKRGGGWIVK